MEADFSVLYSIFCKRFLHIKIRKEEGQCGAYPFCCSFCSV
ncbi:zinc-finger domain-containing protein [Aciduricibacillus chroicocephali]